MPVKSYLVFPKPGRKHQLVDELEAESSCSVLPADNKEVIVLVTDTPTREKEKELVNQLETHHLIDSLSLVSGFEK